MDAWFARRFDIYVVRFFRRRLPDTRKVHPIAIVRRGGLSPGSRASQPVASHHASQQLVCMQPRVYAPTES